ncbi:MAG: TIGR00282 family metallophosphoesterase [Bacillota bacterium]
MRILFIGDVIGQPGRDFLNDRLMEIRRRRQVQCVIANGENAAGGNGLTLPVAQEMFAAGVDLITSGNHIWDKREILDFIDREDRIVRPANYPPGTPGRGSTWVTLGADGVQLAVINLAGRVFLQELDCPFRSLDQELAKIPDGVKTIIVDFHAEASSEKVAMGWYADGKVSAVLGTHTHVQTADERILPRGTAYISDVGMTGPINSVLGVRTDLILHRFLTQRPVKFDLAPGPVAMNAVLVDIEPSGRARSIERVLIVGD